jgi:hypothetical protein
MNSSDRPNSDPGLAVGKLIVLFVLVAGASTAWGAGKTKPPKRAPAARPPAAHVPAAEPAPPPPAAPEPKADPPKTAKAPKAKVYTFSGLDVEGKLKTPQLLFFLNRVKLELDTTSPDKRSFLKELEKTSDDKGL